MGNRALAGVRVIDFCWVGAGSYTTRILADLGADVVKIESSRRMDQIRMSAPFKDRIPGANRSGYFADRNSGKKSVTINLKQDGGYQVVSSLIRSAHVMTNNFSPGTMDRLGLGYDQVRSLQPDIIYAEMSMHGNDGPFSHHVGYGLTIGSVAGLQYLVGETDREPTGTGTNYSDHVPSPGHAAFAILAAIRHWRRTGEGQRLELAQTEATIAVLGDLLLAESLGVHQLPQANTEPRMIVHDTFRTKDESEYVAISIADHNQWWQLLELLDLPASTEPHVALTPPGRDRSEIRNWLETGTREWEVYDLVRKLQQLGIRSGVVQTARDVIERDPQLWHRGHWARLPHVEMGDCLYNVQPIRFSAMDVRPTTGAPCLGEHTVETLHAEGWSLTDIQTLIDDGVLA